MKEKSLNEVIEIIEGKIKVLYRDFIYLYNNSKSIYLIEGFRNRLDELLLLWIFINNISFIDACKYFKINYSLIDAHYYKQDKSQKAGKELIK